MILKEGPIQARWKGVRPVFSSPMLRSKVFKEQTLFRRTYSFQRQAYLTASLSPLFMAQRRAVEPEASLRLGLQPFLRRRSATCLSLRGLLPKEANTRCRGVLLSKSSRLESAPIDNIFLTMAGSLIYLLRQQWMGVPTLEPSPRLFKSETLRRQVMRQSLWWQMDWLMSTSSCSPFSVKISGCWRIPHLTKLGQFLIE